MSEKIQKVKLEVPAALRMSPTGRKVAQLIADNIFWAFLALMIILGSAISNPWVNVGLTAR
tara:strand:- start:7115 stop:7297 length:183 start_codon:yes stop_codon:yes gene_type:complete